ncbi:MAG: SPOR domain-containing protein [Sphingomonadaceae bacterium]|nr:SPOR domain-containing protein [Sphingomonadaceae bacterium]
MKCQRLDSKATRYAICTAMAAVLVSGCASSGPMAVKNNAGSASAKHDRAVAKEIAKAERQVEKAPEDAHARSGLANAYLLAGRFESAVTTFGDAQYLGDRSPRTALSLALAHIGAGNHASAVAELDDWSGSIPAGDYGLALALAGETSRGVQILTDALRRGDVSAKLRQNLAYAYALDGRWSEARLMAAQDVPADQLDARISTWALQGRSTDFRLRVASMIGAPVRGDHGQPVELALSRTPAQAPVALAAETAPETAPNSELPPVEEGESFWLAEATRPDPVPAPVAASEAEFVAAPQVPVASPQSEGVFVEAFAAANPKPGFVSNPVVQAIPVRVAAVETSQRKSRSVTPARALVPAVKASGSGSHLVQLGSFSSQKNADRAWGIYQSRNPELHSFDKTISQAMVRGKKYWRVSAGGFNKGAASQMCSKVKNRGGGCISYSQDKPLPGAIRARD